MNPAWGRALILVCVFMAVLLAAEAMVRSFVSRHADGRAINLRLKMIGSGRSHEESLNMLRRSESSVPKDLPPFLLAWAMRLERILLQAQVSLPTGKLMLAVVIAPMVIFVMLMLAISGVWGIGISSGRILICGVFALLLGTALPIFYFNFRATRMRKKMQEQFPVALDVFVRGLRAGHPIAAALDLLTVEMQDPIGTQFGIVVDEVTYGAELRDALQSMAERWDMEDIRMFVVSLAVQSETGGNLAEILENLSRVIRERHMLMMKVRALSSEGRMTAVMLTVLPILTFVSLFLLNPRFFLDVANDPWFIPGFSFLILLYLIGFVTIRRMVDLKV